MNPRRLVVGISGASGFTYVVRLLQLLRDHGSMAPAELWAALHVSRQGAMD